MADHVAFTRAQLSYFGSFPVPSYHFLYLFPDRDVRHGVEHEDSTVIALGPAERVRSKEGYMEIIGIASHELYHAWNVKRIRPAEWMPYDFANACPSELGYIAEGVTTYMGDLFLFEARSFADGRQPHSLCHGGCRRPLTPRISLHLCPLEGAK